MNQRNLLDAKSREYKICWKMVNFINSAFMNWKHLLDFGVEDEKSEVYSQFGCLEYCKMCCHLQNILFRERSCILVEGPALVIQIIEIKLRLHMLPGKK